MRYYVIVLITLLVNISSIYSFPIHYLFDVDCYIPEIIVWYSSGIEDIKDNRYNHVLGDISSGEEVERKYNNKITGIKAEDEYGVDIEIKYNSNENIQKYIEKGDFVNKKIEYEYDENNRIKELSVYVDNELKKTIIYKYEEEMLNSIIRKTDNGNKEFIINYKDKQLNSIKKDGEEILVNKDNKTIIKDKNETYEITFYNGIEEYKMYKGSNLIKYFQFSYGKGYEKKNKYTGRYIVYKSNYNDYMLHVMVFRDG